MNPPSSRVKRYASYQSYNVFEWFPTILVLIFAFISFLSFPTIFSFNGPHHTKAYNCFVDVASIYTRDDIYTSTCNSQGCQLVFNTTRMIASTKLEEGHLPQQQQQRDYLIVWCDNTDVEFCLETFKRDYATNTTIPCTQKRMNTWIYKSNSLFLTSYVLKQYQVERMTSIIFASVTLVLPGLWYIIQILIEALIAKRTSSVVLTAPDISNEADDEEAAVAIEPNQFDNSSFISFLFGGYLKYHGIHICPRIQSMYQTYSLSLEHSEDIDFIDKLYIRDNKFRKLMAASSESNWERVLFVYQPKSMSQKWFKDGLLLKVAAIAFVVFLVTLFVFLSQLIVISNRSIFISIMATSVFWLLVMLTQQSIFELIIGSTSRYILTDKRVIISSFNIYNLSAELVYLKLDDIERIHPLDHSIGFECTKSLTAISKSRHIRRWEKFIWHDIADVAQVSDMIRNARANI